MERENLTHTGGENRTRTGGENRIGGENRSYSEILREIASSTKNLVQNELALVTAELKESARDATKHLTQVAIFGGLLAISILPFVAFLVIGLGVLLGGMYWLSSLIVAVVFAAIGGFMAYRAFKELNRDFKLPHTRQSLKTESQVVQTSVKQVKDAATKGDHYGSDRLH